MDIAAAITESAKVELFLAQGCDGLGSGESKIDLAAAVFPLKAHGSSDEKLFKYTIKQAEQFVENEAVNKLTSIYESELNKEKLAEIKAYIQDLEKQ